MDPIEILTIAIFILAYVLMIRFYKHKVVVIWSSVVLLLIFGAISFESALDSIDWNVIGIYIGMMFIAEALVASSLPEFISIWFTNKTNSAVWTMIFVSLLSGVLSIFLENVSVVLIMAPIVFAVANKLRISPVKLMIGVAVSSNLQGVALLIGDPPSILLANFIGMNFNDFFFFHGKASLFFAVQLGMLASLGVLYLFFRRFPRKTIEELRGVSVKSFFPLFLLVMLIVSLAYVSLKGESDILPLGGVTMFYGSIALFWLMNEKKKIEKKIINTIFEFDWYTAFFIIAVFIIVRSLVASGAISDLAAFVVSLIGHSMALSFIVIVLVSILISAFVDNIPYLVAMLPLIQQIGNQLGSVPYVLYFGLLIGASVGGNITPIGATANIVAVGLLKSKGYETSFWDFVRIGLPFTLVAVSVSAGFIWLMFG